MIQTTLTKNAGIYAILMAGPRLANMVSPIPAFFVKTRTCHKDCVDTCDRDKSVCGTDPEIGLPENQHGQKHGNSDNTVVISDEFTI